MTGVKESQEKSADKIVLNIFLNYTLHEIVLVLPYKQWAIIL